MTKQELRKRYRNLREQLSASSAREKSVQLLDLLLSSFDFKDHQTVHVYLPILERREVDTFYLINQLRAAHPSITLLTSVTDFVQDHMHTYIFEKDTLLEENHMGIPEPKDAKVYARNAIDVVLMPLLCFDILGNRVGYGKGHYDRFLAALDNTPVRIGLSYFSPVPSITNVETTDIPLDYVATPEHFYRFTA